MLGSRGNSKWGRGRAQLVNLKGEAQGEDNMYLLAEKVTWLCGGAGSAGLPGLVSKKWIILHVFMAHSVACEPGTARPAQRGTGPGVRTVTSSSLVPGVWSSATTTSGSEQGRRCTLPMPAVSG